MSGAAGRMSEVLSPWEEMRVSPHFSQSSVARPFKRRPIRPRGLKGAAGILDSMSKSFEGARPYRVDGWTVAVGSL